MFTLIDGGISEVWFWFRLTSLPFFSFAFAFALFDLAIVLETGNKLHTSNYLPLPRLWVATKLMGYDMISKHTVTSTLLSTRHSVLCALCYPIRSLS